MAAEEGGSGQVPPQPTIRRVFGMMKAYLNEFERQTLPSSRMNEIDAETTHHSLMEAEGSERSAIVIDSEFEPEADDDSEEVDDQSTLSVTVDEEFLVLGVRYLSFV
jgi:hypothetical protein